MKINHLFLFAAIAISSGAVNEVSAQTNWSTQQVMAVSAAEINTRVTPDLAFFNLHGPVKTLKDENGKIWEFTSEGKLRSTPKEYTRNSSGYIVKKTIDIGEEFPDICIYKYNNKMQICQINEEGYEWFYKGKLTYDDRGFLIGLYSENSEMPGLCIKRREYTYADIDKYGNWIKREWREDIEYQCEGEEYDGRREIETGVEARVITYYEDQLVQSSQSKRVKTESSTKINTQITPDLAFFNLRGPVKTLKDEDGKIWEFTPQGSLKSLPKGYSRDSEGYIVKQVTRMLYGNELDVNNYIYNHKTQLIECNNGGPGWFEVIKYTYNKKGLVESRFVEYKDEGYCEDEFDEYSYTQIDKYGNWIKRKWTASIVMGDEFDENLSEKTTKSGTHYRTITYYE